MSRLYRQTSATFLRFLTLLLLCLILMVLDQKQIIVPRVKSVLQTMVTPFEYAVVAPSRAVAFVRDYLTIQQQLVTAEHSWQEQRLLLKAQVQQVNALKIQNQQLQTLLDSPVVTREDKFLLANIVQLKSDALSHEVLLNIGVHSGVMVGQAVVAAEGIAGQIVVVNSLNTRAMLVSDSRSAVPVINERTQENFIVVGTGLADSLALMNVSSSADLKVGDRLISSGMGGHFPAGFPVGTVAMIDTKVKTFAQITVRPAVNLAKLQLVVIPFEASAI